MAPDLHFRKCYRCQQQRVIQDFGSDASRKDGLNRYCRTCHAEQTREYRAKHGGTRRHKLRQKYGISAADYEAMFEQQGGGCWICGLKPEPGKHLQVDHDHVTNETRGLLCMKCNMGLGSFQDRIDLLSRAHAYLEHTQTAPPESPLRVPWNKPANYRDAKPTPDYPPRW